MQKFLNPRWIFAVNTFPVALVMVLFYGQFKIIKSLLNDENLTLWYNFGAALLVLWFVFLTIAFAHIYFRKTLGWWYGLFALVVNIVFVYVYLDNVHNIIPSTVPSWMVPFESRLYIGTFLMPSMVHALFTFVLSLTPKPNETNIWTSIFAALIVPIGWFIFEQILEPLWRNLDLHFNFHVTVILSIVALLFFLFFLARVVFIFVEKRGKHYKLAQQIFLVFVALVFPLLGLLLNNGVFSAQNSLPDYVFGNFSSMWFYILAVVNGLLLLFPEPQTPNGTFTIFVGRMTLMPFTFYFFLVFLPFLPFSVFAIVIFGLGFLMLTPLLLFIVQVSALSRGYERLKTQFSKAKIAIFGLLALSVLPIGVTINYLNDKHELNLALEYLYAPNFAENKRINIHSLQQTIAHIKSNKQRNWLFESNQKPYLSTYYNHLVLNNLTLSDAKLTRIERVFFNLPEPPVRPGMNIGPRVEITSVNTKSTFSPKNKSWHTWVDLELTNNSEIGQTEYATTLHLPTGCWITDYYLYVEDLKKEGILAEKKAATWIYNQIRRINRDPGILFYDDGGNLQFRVFPFRANEIRKTGFEIIHKNPEQITIDGRIIQLGDSLEAAPQIISTPLATYIPAKAKNELKSFTRTPYLHFIIDGSLDGKAQFSQNKKLLKDWLTKNATALKNAKVSLAGTFSTTKDFDGKLEDVAENHTFMGGFFAERVIQQALITQYQKQPTQYPVFVLVDVDIENVILGNVFHELKNCFPEGGIFYSLSANGVLKAHQLLKNPKMGIEVSHLALDSISTKIFNTKSGKTVYLSDNEESEVIGIETFPELNADDYHSKKWEDAVQLQARINHHAMHPDVAAAEWHETVRSSFKTNLLLPVTSYIVLENEAQEKALLRKQQEILNGKKALDAGEEVLSMSEPKWYVVLLLFLLFISYRKYKHLILSKLMRS